MGVYHSTKPTNPIYSFAWDWWKHKQVQPCTGERVFTLDSDFERVYRVGEHNGVENNWTVQVTSGEYLTVFRDTYGDLVQSW